MPTDTLPQTIQDAKTNKFGKRRTGLRRLVKLGFRQREEDRYPKASSSRTYSLICISIIGLFLIALGVSLTIVGVDKPIQDLLILGPIFLIAGVLFTIINMIFWIMPLLRDRKVHDVQTLTESKEEDTGQGYVKEHEIKRDLDPENEDKPTEMELYKKKNNRKGGTLLATPPPNLIMPNDPERDENPVSYLQIKKDIDIS